MRASRFMLAACAAAAIAACDKAQNAKPGAAGAAGAAGATDSAATASAADRREDPCVLVTRAEAEKYLGPLAHDPFRVNASGDPSPDGGRCDYLAGDGRHIYVNVSWSGAKLGWKFTSGIGQAVGTVMPENNGKTDTLEGGWDEARWIGPGSFFAIKNDAEVITDVAASQGGIAAAADLSSKALGRIATPLDYDGGKATAGAPRPRDTGDACALITSAELAAIVGPVDGAPVPSGKGTKTQCTYHVRANGAPANLRIDVTWRDGFQQFAMGTAASGIAKQQAGDLSAAQGDAAGAKTRAMKQPSSMANDPNAQKIIGTLNQLGKQRGVQLDKSGGLMRDTIVAGPWAVGAILSGGTLLVVKNDVLLSVEFKAVSAEQAKALMAKAVARL